MCVHVHVSGHVCTTVPVWGFADNGWEPVRVFRLVEAGSLISAAVLPIPGLLARGASGTFS